MRAITITRHGGPEVLKVLTHPDPTPARGEVRVRVKCCGLNFAELMARQGLYPEAPKPPCVVGYEASGVVDAVGADVEAFKEGDRVLLAKQFGAHADVICVHERQVYPMPAQMTFEEAAALPVNYLTAHHMLFRTANVRPNERVLVHAASGGVGTAVLQLCQTVEGLEVFGTASASKHDHARAQGCTHPIDYRTLDYADEVRRLTGGEGVDVVLDPLGGRDWAKGYGLLRPMGRLVAFGFSNMTSGTKRNLFKVGCEFLAMPRFHPLEMMNANKTISGVSLGHLWGEVEMLRGVMMHLLELYNDGVVRPQVDSTFTFDQATQAHQHMEARKNKGKILLAP